MISSLLHTQTAAFMELVSNAEKVAIDYLDPSKHAEVRQRAAETRAEILSAHDEAMGKLVRTIVKG